jgi:hypothetical protein
MSVWDALIDDILTPVGNMLADGVSAGVNAAENTIREHPVKTTLITGMVLAAAGKSLAESIIDNTVLKKVTPVPGSVVYCDLALCLEHSGIYLGHGKIAHLDGSGAIESVSPEQFLGRLGGANPARTIYISCHNDLPVGSRQAAQRAHAMVGMQKGYDLVSDNCHQFVSGCLTGDFKNADKFFWMVRNTARKAIGATKWHINVLA